MYMIIKYLTALAILLVFLLLGIFVRKIVLRQLIKWAGKTRWKGDDIVIAGLRAPILLWATIFGLYLSIKTLNPPQNFAVIIDKILLSLVIFSVTLVAANIVVRLINLYATKLDAALPATGLTQNITKIIVYAIGGMVLLNSLGISITPLITTLGIGGLAVALALQDTLSNLFSGFHITLSKQIRVGDYVKLETGEEGYVTDITWRTTKIRMLPNNIILIPNSKLAQTIVTNFYLPEKEMAVLVQVGVHYNSDLRKVEKITCEVAKEVMQEVPGGVPEFDPFIRYHTFDDFSINFTVILRAREFVDQYMVKHEFVKRLHERFNKEGIVIPYPIRAINYDQEKAR